MPAKRGGDGFLSPEVRDTIWRILGAGCAPGAKGSAFDHIEPMVRKHVPADDHERAIAMIGAWFGSGEQARWVHPEHAELVAELVIDGVGSRRSEDAVWAIGSTSPDLAAGLIRRRRAAEEVQTLVDAAVEVLNRTGVRARPDDRSADRNDGECTSFREAVSRDGLVAVFAQHEEDSLRVINQGLHPTVTNLIDLAVELSPEQDAGLLSRLEEPTMQARAARRLAAGIPPDDPGPILGWITEGAAETTIALAIVHVLGAATKLDDSGAPPGGPSHAPTGNERPGEVPEHPPDPAGDLVVRLLERLATLDSPDCLRWIGEILNQAPRALSLPDDGQKRRLLARLESECTRLAVSLFSESGSAQLLPHFQTGLRPGRGKHWVRHQMAIARAICKSAPERAEELAQATLDRHRRQLAEEQDGRYLATDWDSWTDREWLEGLGTALALAQKDLDLSAWVAGECRDLPLSVWDAEEDPVGFEMAEQIAQHWFLVALLAIPARQEFHRPVAPPVVRALAAAVWAHCGFCRQHLRSHPEASVGAELAARYAMQWGQADGPWLLEQAQGEGLGPGALRIVLEERRSRSHPPAEGAPDGDDPMVTELLRIARGRFADAGHSGLEALQDWGKLWLSLGVVDQAEQTALAIVSFPLPSRERATRILALKLLGLVVRHRKPRRDVAGYAAALYSQLWSVFGVTPNEERKDREEIEKAFSGSGLIPG